MTEPSDTRDHALAIIDEAVQRLMTECPRSALGEGFNLSCIFQDAIVDWNL